MRYVRNIIIASLIIMGIILACPSAPAQAAAVAPRKATTCGVARPYGQRTSRTYYLFDGPSNYTYGYRFTVALWKDGCPLAFGVGSVQSFDDGAPAGILSLSVFDCDTKTGAYPVAKMAAPGSGTTTVVSDDVAVGPYYFVQVYYADASGKIKAMYQTACIPTP